MAADKSYAASDGAVDVALDIVTHVGTIELQRPPHNFLDISVLRALNVGFSQLDANPDCRAIVLVAAGKNFCAGRDFSRPRLPGDDSASLYREAARLMDLATPWIAVVQGAAIGAGLGLALCADFRLAAPRAYFAANFVTLGLHHGFGLTVTLPRLVGEQRAAELLCSGRKVGADEAVAIGLVDQLVDEGELRSRAVAFATGLAAHPPLAVQSIRATLRGDLAARFRTATEHESREQARLTAPRITPRPP